MLPLKLVRSLVFGETFNSHPLLLSQNQNRNHHDHQETTTTTTTAAKTRTKTKTNKTSKTKTPYLLFLPTKELVTDTYRLATIARDIGMDLYPTPTLSHIIFSYPSSSSPSSPYQSSSLSSSSTSLSSSLSSSWFLPNDAVPLPFPSLSTSSPSHLRSFVSLSKGLFKLIFINDNSNYYNNNESISDSCSSSSSYWDCCSFSLFWKLTGDRIESMDAFCRVLAGMGWTLFKTRKNPSRHGCKMVYLFRKVGSKRIQAPQGHGEYRVREMRLPPLDFRNAPLRILHYILLMTDDLFYIA